MIKLKKDGSDFLAGQLKRSNKEIYSADPDDFELDKLLDSLVDNKGSGYSIYSIRVNQMEAVNPPKMILMYDDTVVGHINDGDYLLISRSGDYIDIITEDEIKESFCLIIGKRVFRILLWLEKLRSRRENVAMMRHATREFGL